MSGSADEWEDLVRRLEATDSGVSGPPTSPRGQDDETALADTTSLPDGAGPGASNASSSDSETRATGADTGAGGAGESADADASAPPPGPRALGSFDFKIDPASGFGAPGTSPGTRRGAAPGNQPGAAAPGPRDSEEPDFDPFVDDFVPPEAEPLLVGRPDRVIAWIVAVGMPLLVLFLLIFVRGSVPALLWPVMLISALASWVYLVWKLPAERPDDGDNGARV